MKTLGILTHQFKANEEKVNLAFPPERGFLWISVGPSGCWDRGDVFVNSFTSPHISGGWSLITVLIRTNIILIRDLSLKSTFM